MKIILFKKRKAEIERLKKKVFSLGEQLDNLKFDIEKKESEKRLKKYQKLINKNVLIDYEVFYLISNFSKLEYFKLLSIKLNDLNIFDLIVEYKSNSIKNISIESKNLKKIIKNNI
jgi:hypothetical protein